MKKKYSWFMLTAVVAIFLLSATTAVSASEWNATLQATSGLENVKLGIDSTATNDFDVGTDAVATMPGGPTQSWTQIALLTPDGASMQTWININNMSWVLKVTINKLATSTISWSTSDTPSYLDVTLNGTTDMSSTSSLELTGDAGGSTVYYLPINATYKTWNATLQATSGLENVKLGIDSTATNDFDVGTDAVATMPGGPTQSWTQIALLTPDGASMQTWININNMSWVLKVTINKLATSTISWSTSDIPSYLDVTLNDTTDMSSTSSLELTGDAGGSTVYYLPINATPSAGPLPPTITTYTISNTTITPPQETSIDVAFSEEVNWIIAIQKDGTAVYDWDGTSTNPQAKIWNGTYETNGTQVPDGVYTVNVTGTNASTGLSVTDISKTITVTLAVLPLTVTASPSTVYVGAAIGVVFNVTDSNGAAVGGATVTLSGCGVSASGTTDTTTGLVTISVNATSAGTITVNASKTGYTNGTTTITASAVPSGYRAVVLVYNSNNIGYNFIAWSGSSATTASSLCTLIRDGVTISSTHYPGVGGTVLESNAFIARWNTTSGSWDCHTVGMGTSGDFGLQQYEPIFVRVASPGGTFCMPAA